MKAKITHVENLPLVTGDMKPGQIGETESGALILCYIGHGGTARIYLSGSGGKVEDGISWQQILVEQRLKRVLPVGSQVTITTEV